MWPQNPTLQVNGGPGLWIWASAHFKCLYLRGIGPGASFSLPFFLPEQTNNSADLQVAPRRPPPGTHVNCRVGVAGGTLPTARAAVSNCVEAQVSVLVPSGLRLPEGTSPTAPCAAQPLAVLGNECL